MILRFLLPFSTTLCLLRAVAAEVSDGAYQDVKVAFPFDLPEDRSSEIINSTKWILQEASQVLQESIGLRIGNVLIRLPPSWPDPVDEEVTHINPWGEDIDVLVQKSSESQPTAIQYGGCGAKGLHVTVPVDWISNSNSYPKGKELSREWIKYRYGVFDENGFDGDPLYPSVYKVLGTEDLRVSDCTNIPVNYIFRKEDGEACAATDNLEECHSHPEDSHNVNSSLMYFHPELPNMVGVCGRHGNPHNELSPNKQNALCEERSVFEILNRSSDFATESVHNNEDHEVSFKFVRDIKPRIIFAWQGAHHIGDMQPMILHIACRLLNELPDNSKLGLLELSNEDEGKGTWVRVFKELDDSNRVPPQNLLFDDPEQSCVSCLLKEAIQVLVNDSPDSDAVLLAVVVANPEEDLELLEMLRSSRVCLSVMGTLDASKEGFQKVLEASPCSSFRKLDELNSNMDNFHAFLEILEDLEQADPSRRTTKMVKTGMLSFNNPITIPGDSKAESFTLWPMDILRRLNCTRNKGPVVLTENPFGAIKSFTFNATQDDVECTLWHAVLKDTPTQIQVTSRPDQNIEGRLLMIDATGDQGQMPIPLYARVAMGTAPVRDARVEAVVTHPNGQSTTMEMFDDGRGDPDVTRYDGIYSRYFTNISSAGVYFVDVTASSQVSTSIGRNNGDRCCGSVVMSSVSQSSPPFTVSFRGYFTATSEKPDTGYTPGRITDLRGQLNESLLILHWTAPGAEMDHGTASEYEFKLFCNTEDCNENGTLPFWIQMVNNKREPQEQGLAETRIFKILPPFPHNTTVRIRVRTVNNNQRHSTLSNSVFVLLNRDTAIEPPKDDPTKLSSSMIGIIVGSVVLAVFLVMCLLTVLYVKPKKFLTKEKISDSDDDISFKVTSSNDGIIVPMRKTESFPILLYTHDQIKDCKGKQLDPPLYKPIEKQWASLGVLNKEYVKGDDSTSTAFVSENSSDSEMKQLESASCASEPQNGTVKF